MPTTVISSQVTRTRRVSRSVNVMSGRICAAVGGLSAVNSSGVPSNVALNTVTSMTRCPDNTVGSPLPRIVWVKPAWVTVSPMPTKVFVSAVKRSACTSPASVGCVTTPANSNPSIVLSSAVRTPRIAAGCGSAAAAWILRASADGEVEGADAGPEGFSLGVAVTGLPGDGEQGGAADADGDAPGVPAGCGDGVARIDGVADSLGVADDVSVGSQVGPGLGPAAAVPAVVSIAKPRAGSAASRATRSTGLTWRTVMAGRRLVARSTRPPLLIEWQSHRRPDRTQGSMLTTSPARCAHRATPSAAALLADRRSRRSRHRRAFPRAGPDQGRAFRPRRLAPRRRRPPRLAPQLSVC